MLPLEKPWYRWLLLLALVIGAAGGALTVAFSSVTGAGIHFLFGNTGTGWWEGKWWWIPLVAIGGLLVAVVRKTWKVPAKVPSPIQLAHDAWVEPGVAIPWVMVSAISLIFGAALGPFFAYTVIGGGIGAWLVTRLKQDEEDEAKEEYVLTGMAGTMGGAYSAPLFGAILTSELSPTNKRNYVALFIPALLAATSGYIIYFGATGTTFLGAYALPAYEFKYAHLLTGALLGVLAAFVLIIHALIKKLVSAAFSRLPNPYVAGVIGGALVGLISFALPLVANSGNSQLGTLLQNSALFGAAFLLAVLIGKMLVLSLSQAAGFLGGVIFPFLFIGGAAGVLVSQIFPDIPIALAVGCMLAAVVGAVFNAPVSLILIAVGTILIAPAASVPISIAVVTAHITLAIVRYFVVGEDKLKVQQPEGA